MMVGMDYGEDAGDDEAADDVGMQMMMMKMWGCR